MVWLAWGQVQAVAMPTEPMSSEVLELTQAMEAQRKAMAAQRKAQKKKAKAAKDRLKKIEAESHQAIRTSGAHCSSRRISSRRCTTEGAATACRSDLMAQDPLLIQRNAQGSLRSLQFNPKPTDYK